MLSDLLVKFGAMFMCSVKMSSMRSAKFPFKSLGVFWFFFLLLERCASQSFGPNVKATKGAIWPKPRFEKRFNFSFAIDPKNFEFQVVGCGCPILDSAIERYTTLMKSSLKYGKLDAAYEKRNASEELAAVALQTLRLELKHPCEAWPSDKMDESYNLTLTHASSATNFKNILIADSIWGLLRGLESFSQILVPDSGGRLFLVDGIFISDSPRFPHRGLLLDTSRHFFSIPHILKVLDGMAYSKMNVFHWHIVDDQSFPFQSSTFPELSAKGAYHPELAVYRQSDVLSVIEYARDRGIRVIPEFDTPGHTRSWGESVPGLLAQCNETTKYGPIDPTKKKNYVFISKLFKEISLLFKDRYMHYGGDEVDATCWLENQAILDYMESHGMGKNTSLLQAYYFSNLVNITNKLNLLPIVWEEVFDEGVPLDNRTVIHMWKSVDTTLNAKVVAKGYRLLYSSCWYLDHLKSSWKTFYFCDPLNFQGSAQEKALVLGGEACMWGEMVDDTNVSPRIWPRACATAERLWTYGETDPSNETIARLEEHSCRLKRRGVPSSPPNGPGYCPVLS